MSVKKSTCLSLKEKAEIIEQLREGSTVTYLALKYNIAKATVCAINKKSEQILNCVNNKFSGPRKRRTLRSSEFPKMEKVLHRWFLQQCDKNYPVNGLMIKEKAKFLHSRLKENQSSFNASNGWLQRFKTRYGVRFLKITCEKQSSQPELVDPFKRKLQQKIHELGLSADQLYNADESGLFWKLLPEKTYVSSLKKNSPRRKTDKQRITFLACANGTGLHKLKPLVIGEAKNPRALKNFNCPVDYKNSKSSWMTADIFKDWFHQSFVPQVKLYLKKQGLPVKALLLLDNTLSHPLEGELKTADGCISTMFMPPNVTPLIEPMVQDAIRITKLYYRSSLLAAVVASQADVSESLEKLTLKDAVIYLTSAWDRLESATIAKCWKNILNFEQKENYLKDDISWIVQINSEAEHTIKLLNTIYPEVECTLDDIRAWNEDRHEEIVSKTNEIFSDEESDSGDCVLLEIFSDEERYSGDCVLLDIPNERVKPSEAVEAFNKVLKWAEGEMICQTDISVVRRLRKKAVFNLLEKNKQKGMTDFLH